MKPSRSRSRGMRRRDFTVGLALTAVPDQRGRKSGRSSAGSRFIESKLRVTRTTKRDLASIKGVSQVDISVEQPTRYELCINLNAARLLSLTIPSTLLARAERRDRMRRIGGVLGRLLPFLAALKSASNDDIIVP